MTTSARKVPEESLCEEHRDAAASMRREHVEIARLTDELERLRDELVGLGLTQAQEERIRRVLHGLETVVKEYFEEEERMCFSVLQAELSPEETREMFATLGRVTEEIRRLYE